MQKHTLMAIANNEWNTISVYCPSCKRCQPCIGDSDVIDFWVEDYVGSNCLLFCTECDEMMVCMQRDPECLGRGEFDQLCEGKQAGCSERLTLAEAQEYAKASGFDLSLINPTEDMIFWRLHLLDLYEVGECKLDTPVTRFRDLPPDTDTSHDGVYLRYVGVCSHCGKRFEDNIWGD